MNSSDHRRSRFGLQIAFVFSRELWRLVTVRSCINRFICLYLSDVAVQVIAYVDKSLRKTVRYVCASLTGLEYIAMTVA
jgi:hypothetical protein